MPRFRIRQNNQTVAAAHGAEAESEIMNYAMQYRADGDLTIQAQHASPTSPSEWYWKRFAFFAKWPDAKAVR